MNNILFMNVDAKMAAAGTRPLGSLAHPSAYWDGPFKVLVDAVGDGNMDDALEAGKEIVIGSVPVPGDPHPRRATVDADDTHVWFRTPGNVFVRFMEDGGEVHMGIAFGRDSRHLAARVLAEAFLAHSGCLVRVDDDDRDRPIALALIRALADHVEGGTPA